MLRAKKRLWIEIVLHLVFWVGVYYVLTPLDSSHVHKMPMGPGKVFTGPIKGYSYYLYIIVVFLAALFYSNIFWVFPKVIRFRKGIVRLVLCTGWFATVFAANFFTVGPFFDQANPTPIDITGKPLPKIQTGDFKTDLPDRIIVPDDRVTFMIRDWWHFQNVILLAFLVILGISIAYFFLKAWAKSELIQAKLHANQLSTEIKFLKSQVNPHFLFNTLNNLFSMAQARGVDELADGISKLSGMMRYMLYDSDEEAVPLSKEITYLEECITLNKLRYADEEVKVLFDHTGPIDDTRIAPMLFIPFVENAFKHGVAIGQRATIKISIVVSGQKLIFTCENPDYGAIKKMDMEISGIGLENVKRRLELVYPDKHRLTIDKKDGKFMVNLEIDRS